MHALDDRAVCTTSSVFTKDYQQGLKRRKDKEIPFCELPEIVVEKLAVWDEYETDYTIFNVCGNDIRVYDDDMV